MLISRFLEILSDIYSEIPKYNIDSKFQIVAMINEKIYRFISASDHHCIVRSCFKDYRDDDEYIHIVNMLTRDLKDECVDENRDINIDEEKFIQLKNDIHLHLSKLNDMLTFFDE
jgi:hypothetical protein